MSIIEDGSVCLIHNGHFKLQVLVSSISTLVVLDIDDGIKVLLRKYPTYRFFAHLFMILFKH